jgi:hypothetical protein
MLNLASGTRERLEGHPYDVAAVVFAPDGKSFVTGQARTQVTFESKAGAVNVCLHLAERRTKAI